MKPFLKSIEFYIHHYPFLVVAFSFAIGYIIMPVVLQIAKKYNFVVGPNKRTSHNGKIPFVGGVNIFVSFLITVFVFSNSLYSNTQFMVLGLFLILLVGFVDDMINIKPSWKLFGEFVAGFCLIVLSDIRIKSFHGFFGIYNVDILTSYLFSFFVFIVIINSINLVDGIDGLASGLGIIYSLFFAIYFQLVESANLAITAYSLLGSLLIFFLYNVFSNKRKMFLGDSGSLLLGYMVILFVFRFSEMNAIGTVQPQYRISESVPSVLFSLLIIPLFDTIRVMLTRMKKGVSPFKADRNHIHHLLLKLGLRHMQASFILIGVTIFFTFLGLIFRNVSIGIVILIEFVLATALITYLWNLINKKEHLE